ncbi:BMC domain-containing protein [Paenibacillus alvei]|uniref:BMC domain-containing protein n=1 Tax=Paenibacillus alvei TaxID=44250 RepID=A0ABT4GUR2_PAEAL|nr:BMC domain-containing protein [Paenibacillus alvei]MCY9769071.1 BMC domain-containing protein [Paenibacillus alvei]
MRHSALGLVEVRGYLGAVAAADAALKAASVTCIGVEIIKGGLVTVKLDGDVGAVQAAVEAGAEMATRLDVLVTRHVIARMHEETAALVAEPFDAHENGEDTSDVESVLTSQAVEIDTKDAEVVSDKVSEKAPIAQTNQAKEASKTEEPKVKTASDAKSKADTAAMESHAKAVSAAVEGGNKVEERKPNPGHMGTVQSTAKPAATVEKAKDAAKSQGNGSASIVKPVPAPTTKRSKSNKKASL